MDLYGGELWNITSNSTKEMHTAWRIDMRNIWKMKIHPRTHTNLPCHIRTHFSHSLEKIHRSFIYNALHNPHQLV